MDHRATNITTHGSAICATARVDCSYAATIFAKVQVNAFTGMVMSHAQSAMDRAKFSDF